MQPEWADQILSNVHDGEIVVPPDKYFAMGDNRDHSWDSRFWGFVDRDAIMGRPVVIYWSVQSARDEEADRSLNGWLLNFFGYADPSAVEDALAPHASRGSLTRYFSSSSPFASILGLTMRKRKSLPWIFILAIALFAASIGLSRALRTSARADS